MTPDDLWHHAVRYPEDLHPVHERIVNWARWSRDRPSACRVFSAERRYRPELLREDEEADRRQAPYPIDVRDALRVYRAITRPQFPREFALTLAAEFIFRLPPDRFCAYLRRHGLRARQRDLRDQVVRSMYSLRNALDRIESTCAGW